MRYVIDIEDGKPWEHNKVATIRRGAGKGAVETVMGAITERGSRGPEGLGKMRK